MRNLKIGIYLFLCLSVLCLNSCRKDTNSGPIPFESQDDDLLEDPTETYQIEMLELLNEVRSRPSDCGNGEVAASSDVRWDSRLYEAALAHATSMNDKNYFSHDGDDGSTVAIRAERASYNWKNIGENIAFDFQDPAVVNNAFENSPAHCKVMNNAAYKEVGIARVGKYWVVVFGTHK